MFVGFPSDYMQLVSTANHGGTNSTFNNPSNRRLKTERLSMEYDDDDSECNRPVDFVNMCAVQAKEWIDYVRNTLKNPEATEDTVQGQDPGMKFKLDNKLKSVRQNYALARAEPMWFPSTRLDPVTVATLRDIDHMFLHGFLKMAHNHMWCSLMDLGQEQGGRMGDPFNANPAVKEFRRRIDHTEWPKGYHAPIEWKAGSKATRTEDGVVRGGPWGNGTTMSTYRALSVAGVRAYEHLVPDHDYETFCSLVRLYVDIRNPDGLSQAMLDQVQRDTAALLDLADSKASTRAWFDRANGGSLITLVTRDLPLLRNANFFSTGSLERTHQGSKKPERGMTRAHNLVMTEHAQRDALVYAAHGGTWGANYTAGDGFKALMFGADGAAPHPLICRLSPLVRLGKARAEADASAARYQHAGGWRPSKRCHGSPYTFNLEEYDLRSPADEVKMPSAIVDSVRQYLADADMKEEGTRWTFPEQVSRLGGAHTFKLAAGDNAAVTWQSTPSWLQIELIVHVEFPDAAEEASLLLACPLWYYDTNATCPFRTTRILRFAQPNARDALSAVPFCDITEQVMVLHRCDWSADTPCTTHEDEVLEFELWDRAQGFFMPGHPV
jgi:hypothetical protein